MIVAAIMTPTEFRRSPRMCNKAASRLRLPFFGNTGATDRASESDLCDTSAWLASFSCS